MVSSHFTARSDFLETETGQKRWGAGPHPLPQTLGLCTLGLQLLPPLRGSCVGLA